MTESETLMALAERVEAATGPDWKLDREIATTLLGEKVVRWFVPPQAYRFTASLDAAMTLARPAPGEGWFADPSELLIEAIRRAENMTRQHDEFLDALPRFVTAASLRAHAGGEG